MTNIALLIDGGHLRAAARCDNREFGPTLIEQVAKVCRYAPEVLYRVLYYDCPGYSGEVTLPVSGEKMQFTSNDRLLDQLAQKELFAVRKGVLKFRGWIPNKSLQNRPNLQDSDFRPDFVQKGVDMRIGLDMATLSSSRVVSRLALITNDTDCVPAMKHARIAGLQIVLISLPGQKPAGELLAHSDFHRPIAWPKPC